jgi:hypothetical protein
MITEGRKCIICDGSFSVVCGSPREACVSCDPIKTPQIKKAPLPKPAPTRKPKDRIKCPKCGYKVRVDRLKKQGCRFCTPYQLDHARLLNAGWRYIHVSNTREGLWENPATGERHSYPKAIEQLSVGGILHG